MSIDTLELILLKNPTFIELGKNINAFKEAVEKYAPQRQLKVLAAEISRHCRYIKGSYDGENALPQFMEVVARAFEGRNLPYMRRRRNLELMEKEICDALTTLDLTLVSVNKFVEQLEERRIKADYIQIK